MRFVCIVPKLVLALIAQTRIERIAQSVTKQVEPEHRQANGDSREECCPWRNLQDRVTGAHHAAPTRARWLVPKAQVSQCSFCQYGRREVKRCVHDERSRDIRKHVSPQDGGRSCAY